LKPTGWEFALARRVFTARSRSVSWSPVDKYEACARNDTIEAAQLHWLIEQRIRHDLHQLHQNLQAEKRKPAVAGGLSGKEPV